MTDSQVARDVVDANIQEVPEDYGFEDENDDGRHEMRGVLRTRHGPLDADDECRRPASDRLAATRPRGAVRRARLRHSEKACSRTRQCNDGELTGRAAWLMARAARRSTPVEVSGEQVTAGVTAKDLSIATMG